MFCDIIYRYTSNRRSYPLQRSSLHHKFGRVMISKASPYVWRFLFASAFVPSLWSLAKNTFEVTRGWMLKDNGHLGWNSVITLSWAMWYRAWPIMHSAYWSPALSLNCHYEFPDQYLRRCRAGVYCRPIFITKHSRIWWGVKGVAIYIYI